MSNSSTQPIELTTIEIAGHHPGPRLLITAGVHGDEYEGIEAIHQLARKVTGNQLLGTLTLIPIVNQSAFLRRQRTAEDGLDLARTCPGSPDGSITERIAHQLSGAIRQSDFYIDLHTGGFRFKILPLVGYMLHSDRKVLEQQRRMAKAFQLPIIWGTSAHLEGRSLSVARDARIPALYAEYGGGGGCNPQGVCDYVSGCLNVMTELGMLKQPFQTHDAPLMIEDDRPDSGHLQLQHPAPCGGYFSPAVALGDPLRVGDRLGTIVSPTGKELADIRANQTGRVLLLASCPVVEPGDTLGVILETSGNL